MTKSLIILFMLVIFCSFSIGQERIDVIHLNNGDIVKGIIIENVPNDYVRIELQGGSIFTYKYSKIAKFTKEMPTTRPNSGNASPTTSPTIIMQQQQQQQQSTPSSPSTNTPSYSNDAQKLMMYESQKKNPTTAVAFSCLLSSSGHAYAGNWGRGLMFTAARMGSYVIALTGIQEVSTEGYYYDYTTTELTGTYWLGMTGTLVMAIWEMVDASSEVKKYNKQLYNRIYFNQPNIGMNIIPTHDGAQLVLAYHF